MGEAVRVNRGRGPPRLTGVQGLAQHVFLVAHGNHFLSAITRCSQRSSGTPSKSLKMGGEELKWNIPSPLQRHFE